MLHSHISAFTHKTLNLTKSKSHSRGSVFFTYFCNLVQSTIVARWQIAKANKDLRKTCLVPFTRKEDTMNEEFIFGVPAKCKESSALGVCRGQTAKCLYSHPGKHTYTHSRAQTHKWHRATSLTQSLPGSSTARTRKTSKSSTCWNLQVLQEPAFWQLSLKWIMAITAAKVTWLRVFPERANAHFT